MASSFQHNNIPGEIRLAPVVQKVDSAIHWIYHYPVLDNAISFRNTYPMDSNFYLVDSSIQLLNNLGQVFRVLSV